MTPTPDGSGERTILWFRRDLRLSDHAALQAACDAAAPRGSVLAVFVLDPRLARPGPRTTFLLECLRTLRSDLGGALTVREGRPERVIPELAREAGAGTVHITEEFTPFGRARDAAVASALAESGARLVATGSPYAVPPGSVLNDSGSRYRVYTPFFRAWESHGWPRPVEDAVGAPWAEPLRSDPLPPADSSPSPHLPPPGEAAARERWHAFRGSGRLIDYGRDRNTPGRPGTSRLSPYLHLGCLHPRTMLADLERTSGGGPTTFRKELAWREFYADVLWHRPESAWAALNARAGAIVTDEGPPARARFDAWCVGRTGYPIVDAGMRQLHTEGWVHNRVRMIVASFLVKDLHLPWQWGARYYLRHLVDGDVASNNHGWQWTAGTGTDAAPYFRVFNPVLQGKKFDPDGTYVRHHVPELAELPTSVVHEPWRAPGGPPAGYPDPIVDHAEERAEALRRYERTKGATEQAAEPERTS